MANNWVIFFYLKEVKWEGGVGLRKTREGDILLIIFKLASLSLSLSLISGNNFINIKHFKPPPNHSPFPIDLFT